MITTIHSYKTVGINAVPVTVECEVTSGIGVHLVGLADAAVKESLLRVVTALQANGYTIPSEKIIINIAPADLHKTGTGYDLPVALAILGASGQEIFPDADKYVVAGELGLDGSVREVPGWTQAAELARDSHRHCILPREGALRAAELLADDVNIYPVELIDEAVLALKGIHPANTAGEMIGARREKEPGSTHAKWWDSIQGQWGAKRALEIAAAGGHGIVLVGPKGKGTVARAITDILPPLEEEEALEVERIYSATGKSRERGARPLRAPHWSASLAALLGGGSGTDIRPGEVSLAHNGVLLIEDFANVPKSVTEALRAPIEDKSVTIIRLKSKVEYPANFLPVLTCAPCPCGHYGEGDKCTCSPGTLRAYHERLRTRIFQDYIHVQAWVQPWRLLNTVPCADEQATDTQEMSATEVAARVARARDIQYTRYREENFKTNADMPAKAIDRYCPLDEQTREHLENIVTRFGFPPRTITHIIRLARTIADLAASPDIRPEHIAEAACYRFLDRESESRENQ